jgi:hypothetical protein
VRSDKVTYAGLILLTLALMFATFGCTPQKRLNRLKRNHPHLFRTDTIIIRDTVRTETVRTDTTFLFNTLYDTITITKDRLQIRTVRLPGDSIWIEGTCLGDTIYIERKIPCEKAIITGEKKFYETPFFWLLIAAGIVTIVFFGRRN